MATRTHRVGPAENLLSIAKDYYGNPDKWRHIYDANSLYLENPNQVSPGQVLVIPHLMPALAQHLLDWVEPV